MFQLPEDEGEGWQNIYSWYYVKLSIEKCVTYLQIQFIKYQYINTAYCTVMDGYDANTTELFKKKGMKISSISLFVFLIWRANR